MISAPSLNKQPLPTTELHILQLSCWGSSQLMDLAAKALTVSSIEDPVIPGSYQMNAEAFLGSNLNHLLDLNGKILI